MNDRQWTDKLRERLADHERPEPEGLWEDIERKLNSGRHPAALPLRRRISHLGVRIGGAAAVVVLLLWVGRIAFYPGLPETGTIAQDPIAETPPPQEVPVDEPEQAPPVLQSEPSGVPMRERAAVPIAAYLAPAATPDAVPGNTPEPEHEPAPGQDSPAGNTPESHPAEQPEPSEPSPAPAKDPRPATGRDDNALLWARNLQKKPGKSGKSGKSAWSAKLLASNVPGSDSKKIRGGYGMLSEATPAPGIFTSNDVSLVDNTTGIMLNNQAREIHTEVKHTQPVHAGLMLSYGLTDRLRLESGLTYTYLGSRLKSGSELYYYETRQSLHYLGIPVDLNFSLWDNRLLNVYLSGGGMMEWGVSGSASTNYTHNGEVVSTDNRDVEIDGLQWSVNAAAGLQLNISRTVGLFAEPGISYHFAGGGKLETIYKNKPLNFNLALGIRLSFH